MSLESRLQRLEAAAPAADQFPGWGVVAGLIDPAAWLAARGFGDVLEAWNAGVRGPLMEHEALRCWLRKHGHASAAAGWLGGGCAEVPPNLESELRTTALVELYHWAGDAIVGRDQQECFNRVTRETILEWHALRDHLANRPIPPPDDALLDRAMRLAINLYPIPQQ